MVVLVTGSRYWTDFSLIKQNLLSFKASKVIEGEAHGADTLARIAAEQMGIGLVKCPARWAVYGKGAGILRNLEMLDMRPDLVLAFHDNIVESKGTLHCVMTAWERGMRVILVQHSRTGPKQVHFFRF